MCHLHPGPVARRHTSSHLARFADEENQGRGIAEICSARRPGRLRPSVPLVAPERFILRLHIAVANPRCVICTPGRSHAAAPAHTSPASRRFRSSRSTRSHRCVICTPGRSHAAAPSRPTTHAQTAEMLMSSHAATLLGTAWALDVC
jgi:hypothetical protein